MLARDLASRATIRSVFRVFAGLRGRSLELNVGQEQSYQLRLIKKVAFWVVQCRNTTSKC